jgi:hypothetical protein
VPPWDATLGWVKTLYDWDWPRAEHEFRQATTLGPNDPRSARGAWPILLGSVIALWRAPAEGVRRGVRFFSMIVTLALLIATAYLAYWGIIGVRSWV